MSKKQDFLRSEQNRDKHPEKMMKGSAAEQTAKAQAKGDPADFQQPGTGKLENDHNKQGDKKPTQTHQANRTPESRHDRLMTAGSENKVAKRKGGSSGAGAGRGTRGAG